MSAEQQLAILPAKEVALAVFSAPNGLDPYLQKVREEIDKFNASAPDVKTTKGQSAYRSIAYDLATSKSKLDAMGKGLVAELKDLPKKIDAERKRVRELLSAWQEEVRKPLTDWENTEKTRKKRHNYGIQQIKDMALFDATPQAVTVGNVIADLEAIAIDDSWQEFLPEAAQAKDQSLAKLRALLAERTQYEAEQAELARLREEREAREKKDRDDQIARDAAEKATREAEAKAQRERDEAAQRARDELAAAEKREQDLRFQTEQAERRAEQAKRERIEAEQKTERDRLDSIEREKAAAKRARQDEIDRQQAAADEERRQAEAREADKAHKAKINRAALDAFIAAGMPEDCARQAVTLIAQRKIPGIAIAY